MSRRRNSAGPLGLGRLRRGGPDQARARGSAGTEGRGARHSAAHHRHRPLLIPLIAVAASLAVIGVAAAAVVQLTPVWQGQRGLPAPAPVALTGSGPASDGVESTAAAESTASLDASGGIEVELPDVVGKRLATAEALLQAAGLRTATRVADSSRPGVGADVVLEQVPRAGARVMQGETVTLTYNPRSAVATPTSQPVIVIDAGHQEKADVTLEPIGPGSTTLKEKVKGGATGVATGIPEYRQTLAISLRLRDRLAALGLRVVMVRTTDAVNIANSRRAIIGNEAGAALVVRVHCDSTTNGTVRGVSTLYPAGTSWTRLIEAPSKRAAGLVQAAVVKATGAPDRGIFGRSDMSGFNYSTVPTIIVESGFMSNADEDRLLANPAYQDKLAAGMAAGVLRFLGR